MSNFKNIEKLGLKVTHIAGHGVVSAENLELLLQSAQVVYGHPDKFTWWGSECEKGDTHSALIFGITPLKKKTKAEAALEFIRELENLDHGYFRDKAKRILEMKDEV